MHVLGDVAKVVQGTLQAERQHFDTSQSILRLWAHESMRVFADRFLQDAANDMGRFIEILSTKMQDSFEDADWASVMGDVDDEHYGPIICSFMDEGTEKLSYEEVNDFSQLKQRCEDKLEDYNLEPKLINMNLVLFKDAIRHICRIHRTLWRKPFGDTCVSSEKLYLIFRSQSLASLSRRCVNDAPWEYYAGGSRRIRTSVVGAACILYCRY